jgi:hypothetical protein
LLSEIFYGLDIDDFTLSRIDITKNIRNVPEIIIKKYIRIMRKMKLSRGFKINTYLEKNTPNFKKEQSFDVCNESRGANFTIYNKHKAAEEQYNSEEILQYFEDVMRVELRCKRKYIKFLTENLTTTQALIHIYGMKETLLYDYYSEMFRYQTNLCYVSNSWQKKFIMKHYSGKKKADKLIKLLDKMKKDNIDLELALNECYNSKNARINKLSAFSKMGFSPIPTSKHISYMSSLDRVLGFSKEYEDVVTTDKCCQQIKRSKGKKGMIFEYETN